MPFLTLGDAQEFVPAPQLGAWKVLKRAVKGVKTSVKKIAKGTKQAGSATATVLKENRGYIVQAAAVVTSIVATPAAGAAIMAAEGAYQGEKQKKATEQEAAKVKKETRRLEAENRAAEEAAALEAQGQPAPISKGKIIGVAGAAVAAILIFANRK